MFTFLLLVQTVLCTLSANDTLFKYVNSPYNKAYKQDSTINNILCLWQSGTYYDCHSIKGLLQGSGYSYNDTLVYNDSISNICPYAGWVLSPYILLFNETQTEFLIAITHYGTYKDTWAECYVGYITDEFKRKNRHPYVVTKQQHFCTESGVHLGMGEEELIKLKGDVFLREGSMITYNYLSVVEWSEEELAYIRKSRQGDMFMRFVLEKGKIIYFGFGYEYI